MLYQELERGQDLKVKMGLMDLYMMKKYKKSVMKMSTY
jgi:hypothetical protein